MTFEEYFQLGGRSEQEQAIRFLLGLSPRMLQRTYLVDPSAVAVAEKRGPFLSCSNYPACKGATIARSSVTRTRFHSTQLVDDQQARPRAVPWPTSASRAMKERVVARIRRERDGNWLVTFPEIRGAHTYGRSLNQLRRRIPEVLRLWDRDPARPDALGGTAGAAGVGYVLRPHESPRLD